MPKQTAKPGKDRMIHIRLPEDIHKKLRLQVVEQDTSIQEWVSNLIKNELKKIKG